MKKREEVSKLKEKLLKQQDKHCFKSNVKTKTKCLIILVILLAIIIAIFGIKKVKNNIIEVNNENALAMTYTQVEDGDETTNCEYVNFDAFFLRDLNEDGYAEKIRGTCKPLGESDTLYFSLNVLTDGILKNGKIQILGDNFYFQTALVDDETIKGNYVSTNTTQIDLKDVNVGTQKLIFGNIRSGDYGSAYSKVNAIGKDITKYNKINKVKFTGTHIATNGTETKIEKEIEFILDWYTAPVAEIPYKYAGDKDNKAQNYSNENMFDESNQTVNLGFKIVTQETKYLSNLSKSYIEGEIPQLCGYDPTYVEITGINTKYTYDNTTRKFIAYRDAILDEEQKIITEAYSGNYQTQRYNEYNVLVKYPIEAYQSLGINTINLNVPVKAYYEAYNNPNEIFSNPVRSNIVEDIISVVYEYGGGDVIGFDVKVGKYVIHPYNAWVISKEKAENLYENKDVTEEDLYEVIWSVSRGNDGTISNVMLKETPENYTDKFLSSDNTYTDMYEYVSNKGIYFTGATNMFGRNGWIDVYNDETNELLHRFTYQDWNKYNKEKPYLFESVVKHIRIETSVANKNTTFIVYNVKKIDNELLTTKISQDQFNKLKLIFSYLTGYAKYVENEEYIAIKNDQEKANYDSIKSIVSISQIDPGYYSTQETKENAKITISTKLLEYNTINWQNGEFLLKFPKEILKLDVNSIKTTNAEVSILGYSVDEKDDGYYLKILTENENPTTYDIIIDCNITPNPKNLTSNKEIELYSINPLCENYKSESKDIYDIDSDRNIEEYVGKNTYNIQLIGPTSLITIETASAYNENHDELETSIAPQVAIIDKAQEDKTAKISASIRNNYSGNISGIKLVGKIPFEGNTFQLNEKELGSTYTTKMAGPLVIPDAIKQYAKVYYSENEIVNEDLEDLSNNWIIEDDVIDYSTIKTYLIDLGTYTMQKGEEQICTYQIRLPENLNYNEIAYSTHAVYFYLETEEGKLKDRTETNKLGFMIAKKYNLEIEKTKIGTDVNLSKSVFKLTEENRTNSRILVTDSEGMITFKDLYVERNYILEEIKTPFGYNKITDKIKFTASVNENGETIIDVIEGNPRVIENLGNYTHKFVIENEPKVNLVLTKYEKDTNIPIANVRYEIKRADSESYVTVSTNQDGKLNVNNLELNTEYELKEVYAKGYYIDSTPIKIKVKRDGIEYKLEMTSGNVKNSLIINNNDSTLLPEVQLDVENEKVPTYTLQLNKYETDTNILLSDAIYEISGPGIDGTEDYTTNENGQITIDNLYAYVDGKNIDGIYTIKEKMPPLGYTLDKQEIKFKVVKTEEEFNIASITGNLKENAEASILEGTSILNISVEDDPLFRLLKIDGTTQAGLPNTKFAIFEVDSYGNELEAVTSRGDVVGELETIDGIEYRIITTDENGEINLDLKSGVYKIIEVHALLGYKLPKEIEERTYYFGIEKTTAEIKKVIMEVSDSIPGSGSITKTDLIALDDGSYIVVGNISSTVIFNAEDMANGLPYEVKTNGYEDAIVIKYNSNDKIEWINSIGGVNTDKYETIKLQDDGFIVVGGTNSEKIIIPAEKTVNNKEIILSSQKSTYNNGTRISLNSDYKPIIIVKYNFDGKVEWIKSFKLEEIDEADSRIVLVDNSSKKLIMKDSIIAIEEKDKSYLNERISLSSNKYLSKYDFEGNLINEQYLCNQGWIDGANITQSGDNGFILTGYFYGNLLINGEYTLDGNDIIINSADYDNIGIILKYNDDFKIEWYKVIDGVRIENTYGDIELNSATVLKDESIIVTGKFYKANIVIPAEETVSNTEIKIAGTDKNNGFIIKYTKDGLVDNIQTLTDSMYINLDKSVQADEGYIVFASTGSNAVTIVAEDTVDNTAIDLPKNYYGVIKFDNNSKVEWVSDNLGKYIEKIIFDSNTKITYCFTGTEILKVRDRALQSTIKSESKISSFKRVEFTDDGGKIALGTFSNSMCILGENFVDGQDLVLENKGGTDPFLVKFNKSNKIEWISTMESSSSSENVLELEVCSDGGYLALMKLYVNGIIPISKTVNKTEDILIDKNNNYLVKYNKDGLIEWIKQYDGFTIDNIQVCDDEIFALGQTPESAVEIEITAEQTESGNPIKIKTNNLGEGFTFCYNNEGKLKWINILDGAKYESTKDIAKTPEGDYIVVGRFWSESLKVPEEYTESGTELEITCETTRAGYIIKYNSDGKVKWIKSIDGLGDDEFDVVESTPDEGALVLGYFPGSSLTIPSVNTTANAGDIIFNNSGIYLIKYNKDGLIDFINRIASSGTYNIRKSDDNGYVLSAMYTTDIPAELMESGKKENISYGYNIVKLNSNYKVNEIVNLGYSYSNEAIEKDSYYYVPGANNSGATIYKVDKATIQPTIPEQTFITIENEKIQYQITTDVKELENGEKGGTISGEDEKPYETVVYGDSSTKEIKIVPNEGYEILKITINDKEMQFIPDELGNVNLSFENMQENKNIVVEFSNNVSNILVHHYIENTTEKIAEDEIMYGEIGTNYTTSPKVDLSEYELITEKIPENASGKYTKEVQEIIYYYKKKSVKLTVNYYLEGSIEPIYEGYEEDFEKNSEYSSKVPIDVGTKYELVEVPTNSEGIITEDTVVNYYYKIKTFKITTKVETHREENNLGIMEQIKGGTISGENELPYETVEYGNDNTKEIIAIPDEGYYIKSITINGEEIDFETNVDGTVILNQFIEMTENKEVKVTFEAIQGKVTIHHYEVILKDDGTYEYTTNRLIEDEIKTGKIGTKYASKPSGETPVNYKYIEANGETTGEFTSEEKEVIYYYTKVYVGVIEKHIDVVTNELLEQVEYTGISGDEYITSEKSFEEYDIVSNKTYYTEYIKIHPEILTENNVVTVDELLEKLELLGTDKYIPNNSEGLMEQEPKEVKYYYIRKANVKVEYVDINTGEKILEIDEEKGEIRDSSEFMYGHIGDTYTTKEKYFENYVIQEELYPENAKGSMNTHIDSEGNIISETIVRYYYAKASAGVIEKHIDIKTNELLEQETSYIGVEGQEYTTKSKEYDGYDVVTNKIYYTEYVKKHPEILANNNVTTIDELLQKLNLDGNNAYIPEKSIGKMTVELIEIKYYYIRSTTVKVQYIDKDTNNKISDDIIIKGHEGDSYKTEEKKIDKYKLVDKTENYTGIMEASKNENGEIISEIIVTYYYEKIKETPKPEEQKPGQEPDAKPNQNNQSSKPNNPVQNQQQVSNSGQTQNSQVANKNTTNKTTNENTPSTGDILPVLAISILVIITLINIIQFKFAKKGKRFIK